MPHLVITDAEGRRIVAIDEPVLTIGRQRESDIRLTGTHISRLHAEIVMESGVYTLRDCASRFGVFVNGERTTEHVLAHGDRIRLGTGNDTDITFLLHDDAPSATESVMAATSELRHMAALLEGLRALGSGRVIEEVLALVLDSAIGVTGAERGFIMLAAPSGELELMLARARGRITLSSPTFATTSRKIPDAVLATGQSMIVGDFLDGELADLHTGTVALGIRHVLCAPLRLIRYLDRPDETDDRVIGVLYLDSRERGVLQAPEARLALETLSTEAALAIENARLYREAIEKAKFEQESRVAATIQQALLPAGARAGEFFTAAAKSIPCRAIGGDFFDYIDLPDGQFGFILGDAAGKGSPAALLAAIALGMFSVEAGHQSRAAPVLTQLNTRLFHRGVEARFLATVYGIVSRDGTLTYANAGHDPPVLITCDGFRRLDVGGLVLGLFDHVSVDEETVVLQPGNCIVAFSDGVTEALNASGEEFGEARILASIDAHRGDSPAQIVSALVADVHAFCGHAPQNDDITMVAVRYDG